MMERLPPELQSLVIDNLVQTGYEIFGHQTTSFKTCSDMYNLSLTNRYNHSRTTPELKELLKFVILDGISVPPWHQQSLCEDDELIKQAVLEIYFSQIMSLEPRFRGWAVRQTAPHSPYCFKIDRKGSLITRMFKRYFEKAPCILPEDLPVRFERKEAAPLLGMLKGMNEEVVQLKWYRMTGEIEISATKTEERG
ncbi:uncharacterized protein KY384_000745 [Bacidia gigantensis]|uniref:uncharacterized protein n=1 Tax=Bacidia gigantensis TaxID=2732470 RepID=UPI001D03D8BD|nr:uncharacterized protein KY384_000745 [Bacidia gigantensis]KAG8525983.1 hypothetical protein KY384_000745 [Bacidia gigantensis]